MGPFVSEIFAKKFVQVYRDTTLQPLTKMEQIIQPQQHIVFARVTAEDYELLQSVTKARGEGLSSFIRRALRRELAGLNYLTDADKKALGLPFANTQEVKNDSQ
jgi:hypothetical protein